MACVKKVKVFMCHSYSKFPVKIHAIWLADNIVASQWNVALENNLNNNLNEYS